jgi:transcriptional regulator with XRE-family HTH domain
VYGLQYKKGACSMNNLGTYIREKRGNRSLREFAALCDISHTHIDSLEKGYDPRTGKPVTVTVEILSKIAKATDDNINYLVSLSRNEEPINENYLRIVKAAQNTKLKKNDVDLIINLIEEKNRDEISKLEFKESIAQINDYKQNPDVEILLLFERLTLDECYQVIEFAKNILFRREMK